jgi:RND family efflux transporter MFP subunit
MKNSIAITTLALMIIFGACQKKEDLQAKKDELKSLKSQQQELRAEIETLEKEIAAADPAFARNNRRAALITAVPVKKEDFQHFVEVSGSVESKRNVQLSAESMGNITNIYATEGQTVQRGALLLTIDTDLLTKNLDQVKTEYELANTRFEKQKNLWDQEIGTEMQYLEAKNRKESLENQMDNIRTQIAQAQVRAPFNGTIDEVMVNEGEMAQIGAPLVRIVNHADMYVEADLSESFIGQFDIGDSVNIHFPSLNTTIATTLSAVGQVINPQNRTFRVEARLPDKRDFKVKPNLLAVLKLKDFEADDAPVIPSNLIQQDNQGDFVYIVTDSGENKYAHKAHIERGLTYDNATLVKEGLQGNELLVQEGFRDVADGSKVKIVENVL